MNINELLELTKQKTEEVNKIKQELFSVVNSSFGSICKEILKDCEQYGVNSISFDAYTPSFNDGDPCEYSVHSDYWGFVINEDECYEECEYLQDDILEKKLTELSRFLGKLPDEFFLETFGDHVTITIYTDGKVKTGVCDEY